MPRLLNGLLLGVALLVGCDDGGEIYVYDAPKGPRPAPRSPSPAAHNHDEHDGHDHSGHGHTAPGAPIDWTLPAGWTAEPGSSMRFATIMIPVEGDEPAVEIRVTPLSPMAGDLKGNIDRWAGQIGLPPVPAEELSTVAQPMTIGGHDGHLISLSNQPTADGPVMQILSAMVAADDRVWFLMIIDEQQRIAPHADDFMRFIESVTFDAPPAPPRPAAPSMTGRSVAGGIAYQKPAAWKDDPAPSAMRTASFILEGEYEDGDVSVTHFPGDVGGLLANINRWRGQVGLPAVDSLDQQQFSRVQIDERNGLAIDLIEPGMENATDEGKRMVVFIIPQVAGETWFFKMTGTYDVVENNLAAFAAFCHSVKFNESSGG